MKTNIEKILKIKRDSLEAGKQFVEWEMNEDRESIEPVPQISAWHHYKCCQTLFDYMSDQLEEKMVLTDEIHKLNEYIKILEGRHEHAA